MSERLPRFVELICAPEPGEGDAREFQAMQLQALERLRELRPGMLIDHIEEPTDAKPGLPARNQPHMLRLRSHSEARTYDELRIAEMAHLVHADAPSRHETILEMVYNARAVLVDSTGWVADPADEQGIHLSDMPQAAPAPRAPPAPPPAVAPRSDAPELPAFMRDGGAGQPAPPPAPAPAPQSTPSRSPDPSAAARQAPRSPAPPASQPSAPPQRRVEGSPPAARRSSGASAPSFSTLCDGRLFCEICGNQMSIQSLGHGRKRYYTCASKHLHPQTESQPEVFFPVDKVDTAVWKKLASQLEDIELLLKAIAAQEGDNPQDSVQQQEEHKRRLARLERDELEVLNLRSRDRISEGACEQRLDEIAAERRTLLGWMEASGGKAGHMQALHDSLSALRDQQKNISDLNRSDFATRRRVLEAVIPDATEYGVHLLESGGLELSCLLQELDLNKVASAAGGPGLLARLRNIFERMQAVEITLPKLGSSSSATPEEATPAGAAPRIELPGLGVGDEAQVFDLASSLRAATTQSDVFKPEVVTPPRSIPWGTYALLLVAACTIAVVFWPRQQGGERENLVDQLGFENLLEELYRVPGGWVGTCKSSWPGSHDEKVAYKACDELAKMLAPAPKETIMLLQPEGIPMVECGPTIRSEVH